MQFRGVTSLKFWGRQKFEGAKCLILGEQQYFVWDAASQDTKWLAVLNILVEHGLLPPPGYACGAILPFHKGVHNCNKLWSFAVILLNPNRF